MWVAFAKIVRFVVVREVKVVVLPANSAADAGREDEYLLGLSADGWVVDHFAVSVYVIDGESALDHHYVLGRVPRVRVG
jgi:hypothetical protein